MMVGLLLAVAVVTQTQYLTFGVTSLRAQGSALEQARKVMKTLPKRLVSVTAFVAAGEDLETVRQELDTRLVRSGKPVLTVVGVAGLAEPGAKVVLEHVSAAARPVNPQGIAFVSGQPASTEKPVNEVAPLVEKSIADLRKAHIAAGVESVDVLRFTCFMSSLADVDAVRRLAEKEFPKANRNYVQLVRSPDRGLVECETVVRLRSAPAEPMKMVQPDGMTQSPNYSHVSLLGPGKVVFSGALYGAGIQDADVRAMFSSLEKTLAVEGSSMRNVAMSCVYPTSSAAADLVRRIRFEFYERSRPPASTMLVFDGLPKGTPFAVQVIAVVSGS